MIEKVADILADFLVAGKQAEVGVNASSEGIVIAGAQVKIPADGIAFSAHDHGHLGVYLDAGKAVHHVHAFALQLLRPLNVTLLVEASLQFKQTGHLNAVLNGVEQRLDNRRIAAHAVERHLDSEDIWIFRRGAQQIDYRLERFETDGAPGYPLRRIVEKISLDGAAVKPLGVYGNKRLVF